MRTNKPLYLALLVHGLMFSSLVFAETAETAQVLPDIEVTATEDSYTLQESNSSTGLDLTAKQTPQSTSIITKQMVADQNIQTVAQALNTTTGVTVMKFDSSRDVFVSRGYVIDHYLVDGMDNNYETRMASEDSASIDIYERADVIRGSAGLMTATGNASAGVNLIRKRANSIKPDGKFYVHQNSHGTYGATLDYGQALHKSGKVRGRFIGNYSTGDTFTKREEKMRSLAYGALDIDLNNKTTLGLTAKYEKHNQHGGMWGGLPPLAYDGSIIDYKPSSNIAPYWTKWDSATQEYNFNLHHRFNNRWNATLQGVYRYMELDAAVPFLATYPDLNTGTMYTLRTLQPTASFATYKYDSTRRQAVTQFHLNGAYNLFGHTHQLAWGIDYSDYTAKNYLSPSSMTSTTDFYTMQAGDFTPLVITGMPTLADYKQTKKLSSFFSTRLQIINPLAIILGTKFIDVETTGYQRGNIKQEIDGKFLPYFGITYDINPYASVYASYTDIYQPQDGIRSTETGLILDKPISGISYETGLKLNNRDHTLQAQLSLFQSKRKNVTEATGNRVIGSSINEAAYRYIDGEEKRKGGEFEITGQITPHLKGIAGYAYVQSKDSNGEKTNTQYPEHTFKLFATYDLPQIEGLTIGGGLNYMSDYYVNLNFSRNRQTIKYQQDASIVANLMAKYAVTPKVELQLNLDNITNEKYISGNLLSSFNQLTYNEPFTATARLTYKF